MCAATFVSSLTSIAEEPAEDDARYAFLAEPSPFYGTCPSMYLAYPWLRTGVLGYGSWPHWRDEDDPCSGGQLPWCSSRVFEAAPGCFCWSVGKWARFNRLRQFVSRPFAVTDSSRFLVILTRDTTCRRSAKGRKKIQARLSVKLLDAPGDFAVFYATAWTEGGKTLGQRLNFADNACHELETELLLEADGSGTVFFELLLTGGPPPGLLEPLSAPSIKV